MAGALEVPRELETARESVAPISPVLIAPVAATVCSGASHTKLKITDRGFVDQVAEVVEHVRSAPSGHVRGDHDTPHKSSASVRRFAAMASKFSRLKLSTGRYRSRTRCRPPAYVRGDLRICMDEYEDVADISQSRNLNCGFRQNRSTVSPGLPSLTRVVARALCPRPGRSSG